VRARGASSKAKGGDPLSRSGEQGRTSKEGLGGSQTEGGTKITSCAIKKGLGGCKGSGDSLNERSLRKKVAAEGKRDEEKNGGAIELSRARGLVRVRSRDSEEEGRGENIHKRGRALSGAGPG